MRRTYRVVEVIHPNRGRSEGICGIFLPTSKPISYLGEIDPKSGVLRGEGVLINKVLAYPNAVGSTVGSYVIYALKRYNKAPKALIINFLEPVTIIASIISDIPLYKLIDIRVENLVQYKNFKACIKNGELIIEG